MGHAWEQMPIHLVDDQAAMIEKSSNALEHFAGSRPRGWLGSGLTETYETPDLLAQAGIEYIGDWVYDDEPTEIRTRHGPLVTLPYSVELNDIPMMLVQHHESAYFTTRCLDSFERLYQEGAERAKIMAIAIHPYITGQPHRIKYLESVYEAISRYSGVLHWNGAEILDWYRSARAGPGVMLMPRADGAGWRRADGPPPNVADLEASSKSRRTAISAIASATRIGSASYRINIHVIINLVSLIASLADIVFIFCCLLMNRGSNKFV